jgi:subtilisin family serine protease
MMPVHRASSLLVLTALASVSATLTGCASGAAPVASSTRLPTTAVVRRPPPNWHLLDPDLDGVPGIGSARAYRELLAGMRPKREIVVAIIDGGFDTSHVALHDKLWRNPREVPGNGRDDDGNGYVDDIRGWNFLGGAGGRNVTHDTFEVTRLYARCTKAVAPDTLSAIERSKCPRITAQFEAGRADVQKWLASVHASQDTLSSASRELHRALGVDSLTVARVESFAPSDSAARSARITYLRLAADETDSAGLARAEADLEEQRRYSYDPSFDPRPTVGDDYANPADRRYGNADVVGHDPLHGTHVAGIISAVFPDVRLMVIRTVPGPGDERDKDVANSIRYAVANGAHVLSMSFGKGYSPQKGVVDDAARYADAHGVLIVHAAGNNGASLDTAPNYPTAAYQNGERDSRWIEVGASAWHGGDTIAARWSNYSHDRLDIYAPGAQIRSTLPGNTYGENSGTSMATPVVAGVAAMLLAYFPELTAEDVKRIIMASARHPNHMTRRPGGAPGSVPFDSLSVSGGIVNAYAAVLMAKQETVPRP